MTRLGRVAATGTLLLVGAACSSSSSDEGRDDGAGPASPTSSSAGAADGDATASADVPEPTTEPTSEPLPPPTSGPAELERWFDADVTGGDLRLGEVRESTGTFTSYDASYRSEGLLVTGVLNVPAGEGPFPAVVLAHGYIDPAVYVSGQGMTRERGRLAEAGYVAFHVDYRNHAGSDDDPALDETQRFGYAVDVINAVTALRDSADVPVDDDRVSLFGRSMGGGAVLEALEMAPGHAQAAVIYASVASDAGDNQRQFSDGGGFWDELAARVGTPEENPAYYAAASTGPHVDRITEPVLIVHGTADDTCPPAWAEETHGLLLAAGAEVRLDWYEGEGHAFGPQFDASMDSIATFLEQAPA
ncbi:dipeptidyl aminopeptidase/acylaminoacyl peptidase [Nocardioides zeae]|uniref:Dipeptidyl aminopeptidase/acylaminoacyl peptidase n=1 Tax=Nocardioides zeae TaxID=1457234 RepID=A0ACC6ICU1_9ACTN|nr:prolyl oligopeptidase family serine peptidase [Nocardioides zeae]MDR6175532.1 dipeptidyl aminopeptidase/acylaminoacyl peptidase [Nocardioides zeae]MDR6208463.1 dipeptidyl aminopeptidase/acylaminoacyl peptidase [Nocardioides zeae]